MIRDTKVPFPAYTYRERRKTDARRVVGYDALVWLRVQHRLGVQGAVVFDIDDTILNHNENVTQGFEEMHTLFREAFRLFVVYVVTARPRDQHGYVMKMLHSKGFCLSPDRLFLLPTEHYGGPSRLVEAFKWESVQAIQKSAGRIVARFGDKLWDVAPLAKLHNELAHVDDADTYRFMDETCVYASKLPG